MQTKGRTLKVGTRGSPLALAQTRLVIERLQKLYPKLKLKTVIIKTTGDRVNSAAKLRTAGKGLFVKEIEAALLRRKIDFAVHSLKDMPSDLPEGLLIGAVLERGEAADAFLGIDLTPIEQLKPGSAVGTSSLRRQAQLRQLYPHLRLVDIKGNLDSRVETLRNPRSKLSGIVVAAAGVQRLYRNNGLHVQLLPKTRFVPAPGQGALCIECRANNERVLEKIAPLNHEETEACTRAERWLMKRLEGGCQIPLGAHAEPVQDHFVQLLKLSAYLGRTDGSASVTAEATGALTDPESLAGGLETILRSRGASVLLEEFNASVPGRRRSTKKKKTVARRRR